MTDKPNFQEVLDAAREGNLASVVLAISQGFDINGSLDGWSFLHWLVADESGATKHIIEFLLSNAKELGLDVNVEATFADYWTPLILASSDDLRNASLELLLKYAKETKLNVNYECLGRYTGLVNAINNYAVENINTYAKYLDELSISVKGVDAAIENVLQDSTVSKLVKAKVKEAVERIKRIKK